MSLYSMLHITSSIAAIVLYGLAAILLAVPLLRGGHRPSRGLLFGLGFIAVAAHAISAATTIYTPHGIDLGFFRVSSLIFWVICLISLLSSLRRPLHNLLAVLFPLAMLAIIVSSLVHGPNTELPRLDLGLTTHILLSILAYSVLTIAALQAAALAVQEHQLKQRHLRGVVQALPPLQTMESMLFELLWAGVILLTLAIATGFFYVSDLFAQHLVHKTILSIAAWLTFTLLLAGHHTFGWRSQTAVRWTLGGFIALMLAYFGTKLVLEVIKGGGG